MDRLVGFPIAKLECWRQPVGRGNGNERAEFGGYLAYKKTLTIAYYRILSNNHVFSMLFSLNFEKSCTKNVFKANFTDLMQFI